MPGKDASPKNNNLGFYIKSAAGVSGAIMTVLGMWWAISSQIENIIEKKNKEVLVNIETKMKSLDDKIQDNTAVVLGVLADDFRDRMILIDYEIQDHRSKNQQVPFELYTRKKQLEENLEDIKKWQE